MATRSSLAADLLARWREGQHLSQVEVCHLFGTQQGWYSKLERGIKKPGRSLAVLIEQKTGGAVPVAAWDLPAPSTRAEKRLRKAS